LPKNNKRAKKHNRNGIWDSETENPGETNEKTIKYKEQSRPETPKKCCVKFEEKRKNSRAPAAVREGTAGRALLLSG
jgi:hypothetical protein